jgi:hypothetical protein
MPAEDRRSDEKLDERLRLVIEQLKKDFQQLTRLTDTKAFDALATPNKGQAEYVAQQMQAVGGLKKAADLSQSLSQFLGPEYVVSRDGHKIQIYNANFSPVAVFEENTLKIGPEEALAHFAQGALDDPTRAALAAIEEAQAEMRIASSEQGDEGSEADWEQVRAEALRILQAEMLDRPDAHLTYVRDRIKSVFEHGTVES